MKKKKEEMRGKVLFCFCFFFFFWFHRGLLAFGKLALSKALQGLGAMAFVLSRSKA